MDTTEAIELLHKGLEPDDLEGMAIAAYALAAFRDGMKPDEYGWPVGLPVPARNEEDYKEISGGTCVVLRNISGPLAIVRVGRDPGDLDSYELLEQKDWPASID